ncbi:MAG: membrane protein insertase YidC [Gammaproteobacteria bacterium]|nr:membrane protein insertase YidC [Gammaproteobacteria bacterium]
MIDSRLFGYITLAFISILIYQAWQQDYGVKVPQAEDAVSEEALVQDVPKADFSSTLENASAPPSTGVADSLSPGDLSVSADLISVETDVLRLQIDPKGGTVVSAELLDYSIDLEHPEQPVHIFSIDEGFYVAQSGLQAKNAMAPDHYAEYKTDQQQYILSEGANELRVPFFWQDASGLKVTKTFILKRGDYDLDVVHQVENGSQQIWQGLQYRQLQHSYVEQKSSMFSGARSFTGGVIYSPDEHYEKIELKELSEKPLKRNITNGWIAMIQHYFLAAWIPQRDDEEQFYSLGVGSPAGERYVLGLKSTVKTVATGESAEFVSKLYVGPKIIKKLEKLATGLELTVDYGYLTVISQPLFWLLQKVYDFLGNWGWAIIIVTLMIKAVFYKLAETSYRSMANMRRVQPKMAAIKERYGDDKQRQSKAMMELYKKEKINPLGGCLPMVIQIPVFIALYWVLLESVELRQAPFMFWIHDLSTKDPYFVLPVIMGISMFIQQKLNPAPVDPIQAKVFMLLPFIFTVFFAFFPAGLVLYWVVNNVLTIAQQWFITRRVLADK